MKKVDLLNLLNDIFIPLNFNRKGNNWVLNGNELTKLINLQKSNYGNSFYINYGYIIKGLELTTTLHIYNRLVSTKIHEQKNITNLLDLEVEIPDNERLRELKILIINKSANEMKSTKCEEDLLNELKKRPHLNDIPLVVKEHFKLNL